MEIEVKEWVRLKDGRIRQFKQYVNKEDIELTRPYNTAKVKDIVKHSKNIIDLVEVDDLIKTNKEKTIIHIYDIDVLEAVKEDIEEGHFIIETIVTHEQFASIEYKVEEDK